MTPRRMVCHAMAVLFCMMVVVPVVLMYRDQESPIEIHSSRFIPEISSPGDIVRLSWVATEKRACDGMVHRQFVDSAGVIFTTVGTSMIYRDSADLGRKTFSRDVQIPSGIAPGPALFTGIRRYWCNPLQRMLRGQWGFEVRVLAPTIHFDVKPRT